MEAWSDHCLHQEESFTDKRHNTIIVAPGHRDFIKNKTTDALQMGTALISSFATAIAIAMDNHKEGEIEGQIRQHSSKQVSLLASVAEFDCFFRGRCSMEMWCPDDIGRDSWDWVGPPPWGRACFNSTECGVEAPRLLKRSLTRLYCCCCCLGHDLMCVYGHSTRVTATVTETNWWQVTYLGVETPSDLATSPPMSNTRKTTLQQHLNSDHKLRDTRGT